MGLHCGIMADNSSIKLFILSLLLFSVWLWASLRRKIIFKEWCRTHDCLHNIQFHFGNGTALKQFFICYLYWTIESDSLQQKRNGPNNNGKYWGEEISQATIWLYLAGTKRLWRLLKVKPFLWPLPCKWWLGHLSVSQRTLDVIGNQWKTFLLPPLPGLCN